MIKIKNEIVALLSALACIVLLVLSFSLNDVLYRQFCLSVALITLLIIFWITSKNKQNEKANGN